MTKQLNFIRATTYEFMDLFHLDPVIEAENIGWVSNANTFQGLPHARLCFLYVLEAVDFNLLELANDWQEYIVHYREEVRRSSKHKHISRRVHEKVSQHFQEDSVLGEHVAPTVSRSAVIQAMVFTVLYSSAVWWLRRPFLFGRYFFVTVKPHRAPDKPQSRRQERWSDTRLPRILQKNRDASFTRTDILISLDGAVDPIGGPAAICALLYVRANA